ncbi:MAG: fumarylacetoacetate hydrolase family protein [Betaproteobacteria bacterium]|nr:fumarylacetoacetate hydrolase family protein [Betaproteobacteria bacterium]
MNHIFPLHQAAVPITGSQEMFPVRRIYCVGRNYAEHAKEMGFDARELPFFFCKPADAVVPVLTGTLGKVAFPSRTDNLQHEIELVVAIGKGGGNIPVDQANAHVFGYAVGLDMTRRDLQFAMRDKGRPWEIGKAFDQSAPLASIHPLSETGILDQGAIRLKVNGQEKQSSDIAKLIWSVPEIIANLSEYFSLAPGDLIFTGTPEGVGKVEKGDTLVGSIAGLGDLSIVLV